jgi:hypothetical protein
MKVSVLLDALHLHAHARIIEQEFAPKEIGLGNKYILSEARREIKRQQLHATTDLQTLRVCMSASLQTMGAEISDVSEELYLCSKRNQLDALQKSERTVEVKKIETLVRGSTGLRHVLTAIADADKSTQDRIENTLVESMQLHIGMHAGPSGEADTAMQPNDTESDTASVTTSVDQSALKEVYHTLSKKVEDKQDFRLEVDVYDEATKERLHLRQMSGVKWETDFSIADGKEKALRFDVFSTKACYLYLFDCDSTGELAFLFPNGDTPADRINVIRENGSLSIPSSGGEITIGAGVDWEDFTLFATTHPVPECDSLAARGGSNDSATAALGRACTRVARIRRTRAPADPDGAECSSFHLRCRINQGAQIDLIHNAAEL